jgi:hypothetical protein
MSDNGNLKPRDSPFLHFTPQERFNVGGLGLLCFRLDLRPRHVHVGKHQQTTENRPQRGKRECVRRGRVHTHLRRHEGSQG